MAMTKKEQAEVAILQRQTRYAYAMKLTPKVLPDVLPPANGSHGMTTGWYFNSYNGTVSPACSTSTSHSKVSNDKPSSQQKLALYSTKSLALKALRNVLEEACAASLAGIDADLEKSLAEENAQAKANLQKLVIVTDDHGGALEGRCVMCNAAGWIGTLRHKPGCIASTVASENL